MTKIIVNVETGEIEERELNDEEIAQQKLDEINLAKQQAEIAAKEESRSALLERLGITEDEAKLLLGGN